MALWENSNPDRWIAYESWHETLKDSEVLKQSIDELKKTDKWQVWKKINDLTDEQNWSEKDSPAAKLIRKHASHKDFVSLRDPWNEKKEKKAMIDKLEQIQQKELAEETTNQPSETKVDSQDAEQTNQPSETKVDNQDDEQTNQPSQAEAEKKEGSEQQWVWKINYSTGFEKTWPWWEKDLDISKIKINNVTDALNYIARGWAAFEMLWSIFDDIWKWDFSWLNKFDGIKNFFFTGEIPERANENISSKIEKSKDITINWVTFPIKEYQWVFYILDEWVYKNFNWWEMMGSDNKKYTLTFDATTKERTATTVDILEKTEEEKQKELNTKLDKADIQVAPIAWLPAGTPAPQVKELDGKLYQQDNDNNWKEVTELTVGDKTYTLTKTNDTRTATEKPKENVDIAKTNKELLAKTFASVDTAQFDALFKAETTSPHAITIDGQSISFAKDDKGKRTSWEILDTKNFGIHTISIEWWKVSIETVKGITQPEVIQTTILKDETTLTTFKDLIKPASFANETFWNAFTSQIDATKENPNFKLWEDENPKIRSKDLLTALQTEKAKTPSPDALTNLTLQGTIPDIAKLEKDGDNLKLIYKESTTDKTITITKAQAAVLGTATQK